MADQGAAATGDTPVAAAPRRRSVLGIGAGVVGAAGAGLLGYGAGLSHSRQPEPSGAAGPAGAPTPGWVEAVEPFFGSHQPGIATAPQAHVSFVALDLLPGAGREGLRRLLRMWTDDASRLQRGIPTIADPQPDLAGPPSRLTVTVGLGRGALVAPGLEGQAPEWLRDLPAFTVDRLERQWSSGDVVAQVCCEDPTVLAHAVRALLIDATGIAELRWHQQGFRRPASSPATMRNLFGQVDGTVQPEPSRFDELVWCGSEVPAWLRGGSSLVLRRIHMNLETWDELDPAAKEAVIGRRLTSGAPLTGQLETDQPDLEARTSGGLHVIPDFAHARQAAPAPGAPHERILRRPYSYDEGLPGNGGLGGSGIAVPRPTLPPAAAAAAEARRTGDAGLLFAAYQRDPVRQFVPIQRRLDTLDLLNVWTTPIGSAVFAMLPGVAEGSYLGAALLDG